MRTQFATVLCIFAFICCLHTAAQTDVQMQKMRSPVDSLKGTATTSVAIRTRAERFDKGLIINPLDVLNGRLAGVNVSRGGDQRQATLNSVRVRGTTSLTGGNDPLVVIDGISSDIATLSTIYPADINSFRVLKNASETAQYGSRGASGVILVTTVKGVKGQFRISYDGNIGFERAYKNLKMLNRSGYISTAQALGLSYNDGGEDNNFPDAITRTGFVQNHHIAFTGGNDLSNYRASVSVMERKMVVRTNGHRNFTAKFDLMQKAFDNLLTVNFGVFGASQADQKIFDTQKLFYSAATQNPTFSKFKNASGGWDLNTLASQIAHPMALLLQKDDERGLNFNTHITFDFAVAKHLNAKLFTSYSYSSLENAQFQPTWTEAQGRAYRRETKSEDVLGSLEIAYRRMSGQHEVDIAATAEYQKSRRQNFFTTVRGFASNEYGYNNLMAGSIHPYGGTGSGYESPSLASFSARAAYTWLQRYGLTLNVRADGSSLVGRNNAWGYFPSVGAEWNVKQEPFLRQVSWINQLKLRTSYGKSGNLGAISAYNALYAMMPNGVVPYYGVPTVTQGQLKNVNPDLKWETKTSFNIGVEAGLLNNRMQLYAEYYYSKTTDMLYNYDVSVPPFAFNKLLANIGSMSNSGFECGIGADIIRRDEMELSINVNLSMQRNRLLSLSGKHRGENLSSPTITPIGALNGAGMHGGHNSIVYQIVGQPLGVFYLPHCTALEKAADGSYRYACEDIDKNGKINLEDGGDRYIAGQAVPKASLGSNISFRYRRWDVAMQMNGAFGHKIYNATALTYMNMGSFPDYNVMQDAPERNIKDQTATDYWLENGDYLNIEHVTIGYNLPLRCRHISSMRLSLSINNLATITAYNGLTPILNSYVVNSTLGIDDKRSYPPYRSFSLGVSIRF